MGNLVPVEVKNNIGSIEDNLDKVEASIKEKVSEYSAIVVTEDTIKDGKKFLADIRKEKKALDDERKEIKDAWMAPYTAFEKRVKNIISLYDEPVKIVNDQLDEYEQHRKEMKRAEIKDTYEFVKGDMEEWLPLESIYDTRWENATYSSKKIREDMELCFDQIKMSISTIKTMESEFEEEGLAILKQTRSLQSAIDEMQSRKRMKEEILAKEAKKKQEEELRIQAEEQNASQNVEPAVQEEPAKVEKPVIVDEETGEVLPLPFAAEQEVIVKVHVRESNLEEFETMLKDKFMRYEVM